MKKKLGILEEVAYSYRLMQRLNQNEKSGFIVYSFSEKDSVEIFMKEDFLDVLLVGEDYYEDNLTSFDIGQIIILAEENIKDRKDCIYKYQAASNILKQLNIMLMTNNYHSTKEEFPVKILGIYSPVRRCGKTSLSIALAKKLAKKHDVLYLNLEPFPLEMTNNFEDRLSLSDVFYFLEQGKSQEDIFEKAIVEYEGIKIIRPMESPVDLQGIDEERWNDFFMKINGGKAADVIVINFDECVSCFLQLFDLCEKIYMPVLDDDFARKKVKYFDDFLGRSVSEEIENKICRLYIPVLGTDEFNKGEQFIHSLLEAVGENG